MRVAFRARIVSPPKAVSLISTDRYIKHRRRTTNRVGGSAAAALPANGKSSLTLPNEVRDPIGDVVLDELVERVLADETLRPNDFEPKLVTR